MKKEIEEAQINIKWLNDNQSWIDELGIIPAFLGLFTIFRKPTHQQTILIIRSLRGKWEKDYGDTYIDYNQSFDDGRHIHIANSEPPQSCKLVPIEEVVPAHWAPETRVTKFKLQCTEPKPSDDPLKSSEPVVDAVEEIEQELKQGEASPATEAASEVVTVRNGEEI